MPPAGEAIAAVAAHDVPFAADDFAGIEILHVVADGHDFPDKFVAHHHRYRNRLLGPGVPVVNVHVGAADARAQDFYEAIVVAAFGHRHFFEPEADFAVLFD